MTIGDLIRGFRKANRLTQKELAEQLGVTQATVQQYESGKRNPKISTLEKIAKALNVQVNQLIPEIDLARMFGSLEEYERIYRNANASDGVVSILRDMYGYAEWKEVMGESGMLHLYCLVGTGEDKFVLHSGSIHSLLSLAKETMKPLIAQIKINCTEDEYINETLARLSSPESYEIVRAYEEEGIIPQIGDPK